LSRQFPPLPPNPYAVQQHAPSSPVVVVVGTAVVVGAAVVVVVGGWVVWLHGLRTIWQSSVGPSSGIWQKHRSGQVSRSFSQPIPAPSDRK
jgi:hypothetical protein